MASQFPDGSTLPPGELRKLKKRAYKHRTRNAQSWKAAKAAAASGFKGKGKGGKWVSQETAFEEEDEEDGMENDAGTSASVSAAQEPPASTSADSSACGSADVAPKPSSVPQLEVTRGGCRLCGSEGH